MHLGLRQQIGRVQRHPQLAQPAQPGHARRLRPPRHAGDGRAHRYLDQGQVGVRTGWDYPGEAGIGGIAYTDELGYAPGLAAPYPALVAFAGDIDITGATHRDRRLR